MNIDHKKTALDDNASIYSRNREASNKESVKNLTGKQKLRYFKDYYAVTVAVVLVIIIGVCMLINDTIINPSHCVLSVACVDDTYMSMAEELGEYLDEYLTIESKNDYASVSNYDLEDYQNNMAYITHVSASGIDLIICTQEYFDKTVEQGMFADLSELLPEETYQKLSDRLIEGQIAETDIDGNVTEYLEAAAYGIDISGSIPYDTYGGYESKPILCVCVNSPNTENTLKVIDYFTEFAE